MCISDWSSDVCSSDLLDLANLLPGTCDQIGENEPLAGFLEPFAKGLPHGGHDEVGEALQLTVDLVLAYRLRFVGKNEIADGHRQYAFLVILIPAISIDVKRFRSVLAIKIAETE